MSREEIATLRVGMKVVCIHDKSWKPVTGPLASPTVPPAFKEIYTIWALKWFGDRLGLRLRECAENEWFQAFDFRPLVTKTQEQDMDVFNTILNGITPQNTLSVLEEMLNQ